MVSIAFLDKFKKNISKLENVSTDFRPPAVWYSSGNYAINRIISGDYFRGIPQGRITLLCGPSGSGKSFTLSNVFKSAQDQGAFILAIDSENALDFTYLGKIGVDTSETRFLGISVTTIADAISVVSDFIKEYEKEHGKHNENAPKVVIGLDSLDMLLTETESNHFNSGEQKGDQGQRAKQLKAFLRTIVSRIKSLNIAFVGTHQVYPADVLEGEGKWKVNNAIRYSASQIALITKLRLKEGDDIVGIRMSVETFKSRFAKPGSKVEVHVPYDRGLNPLTGLLELLEKDGVVQKNGGWYQAQFPDQPGVFKFQRSQLTQELAERLLNHPIVRRNSSLFDDALRSEDLNGDQAVGDEPKDQLTLEQSLMVGGAVADDKFESFGGENE